MLIADVSTRTNIRNTYDKCHVWQKSYLAKAKLLGRSMSEKISATVEDYLWIMFILERDGEAVTGVRLADLLGVTPPTVTNTLKRMVRDGLITMDASHLPHFTPAGEEAASSVIRKHMLAEWMLNPMVDWSKLHKEAHALEHAISNEVETALLKELDNPEVCPHGNPLPGYEDAVSSWIPLTQVGSGDKGIIRRIHEFAEENSAILAFLAEKHIAPGEEVQIEEILPFNETITLRVGQQPVSLGLAIARYIFIEPV
jgi:DtxR family transcriptional regulator, Mn-dependent transcriptional regulator